MDDEVLQAMKPMKKLQGSCIWDNEYFMEKASKSRQKAKPETCVGCLKHLQGDPSMKAETFKENSCSPYKVLEVWKTLMVHKFGAVAETLRHSSNWSAAWRHARAYRRSCSAIELKF